MTAGEITAVLNDLTVTGFVLLRGLEDRSRLWIGNSSESVAALESVGVTDIPARTDVHGIEIHDFLADHGIIYVPDMGFAARV